MNANSIFLTHTHAEGLTNSKTKKSVLQREHSLLTG